MKVSSSTIFARLQTLRVSSTSTWNFVGFEFKDFDRISIKNIVNRENVLILLKEFTNVFIYTYNKLLEKESL